MIPNGKQWTEIAALDRGDLSATPYAVLLAALARAARTGVLRLVRLPVRKQIVILEGRVVECRSNLAHETFSRFLLSEGVLDGNDQNSALSESLSKGVPIGEILVARKLLSPHDVYRNLQKNLARKLLDAFTWANGSFEFDERVEDADPTVSINTPQLIVTGVLKLTPQEEIQSALDVLRAEPLALAPEEQMAARLRLPATAAKIVAALESQPMTALQVSREAALDAAHADRAIYALLLADRIRLAKDVVIESPLPAVPATDLEQESEPWPTPQSVPQTAPRPAPTVDEQPPPGPTDQQLLLRQASIVESFLSCNRKDSFDFFGLEEGVSIEEIDRAYLEAAEIYAPWTLSEEGSADFRDQGRTLFLKAAQAYGELRNTESRGSLIHRRRVLREEEAARKRPQFAIETDLLDSREQFKKGLALIEAGDETKGLELVAFAVDCDPQNALYRAELSYRRYLHSPAAHRQASTSGLREARRIDPKCGIAYYYLGLILADQDDLAGAEETLRRSIKLMAPDRRPIDALRDISARNKKR